MSGCLRAICSDRATNVYTAIGALGGFTACVVGAVYVYNQSSIVEKVAKVALEGIANNNTVSNCYVSVAEIVQSYAVLSPKVSILLNIGSNLLFGGVCMVIGKKWLPAVCNAKGNPNHEHRVTPNVTSTHHDDPLVKNPLLEGHVGDSSRV